ncbi:MAG: hypothetical protein ACW98D_08615 [Promethearchaeota archaeon]
MKKKLKVSLLFVVILSVSVLISVNTLSLPVNSRRDGIIIVENSYREVTLVEPTPLRGCNGLVFGLDGALYVCQTGANTISKIKLRDAGPHHVEEFVGPHHGVYVPDDITVDDKGNFYATSAITGEVYKIDSLGMKKVIGRGFGGPNGICYDELTGRLFMSECFWGNEVWELDPEGILPPRLLTAALPVPEGFDIRGNNLVIPDLGLGWIVEVDMDTGDINPRVTSGLITPVALTIGPNGYVYIVEMVTGLVKKITPDYSNIEILAALLPGLDNLAFGPDGNLYVSSYHDCTIWKIDPETGENTMLFPLGINTVASIVIKDDTPYLCDSIMIRMIDDKGELQKTWANGWLSATSYPSPISMANGLGDYLITANFISDIVVAVNPNIAEDWVPLAYPVNHPAGMELNEENKMLYVAEYGEGQVIEINPMTGDRRVVAEDLSGPVDIESKDSILYVAEALAGRISKVDIESGVKEIFLNGYTGKPKGLAWDREGNLLILDTAMKELIKVNMGNLKISVIAKNLPTGHTTFYHHPFIWDAPAAIAVDDNGDIFMGGADGRLFKLKYIGKPW